MSCVSALPAGKPTPYNSRHSEHTYRVLPASTWHAEKGLLTVLLQYKYDRVCNL